MSRAPPECAQPGRTRDEPGLGGFEPAAAANLVYHRAVPIYEFYCSDCHRLFSFLSRAVNTEKRPACPRCGRAELARQASAFAISKGRKEPEASKPGMPEIPGLDEARLERAMAEMEREAGGMDEDDPRQAARMMRRLFDASGMPMGSGMQEALRRMEAGEDPESVEAELGDVLAEDPFAAAAAGEVEPKGSLARLRRRVLPPSVDPNLYDL